MTDIDPDTQSRCIEKLEDNLRAELRLRRRLLEAEASIADAVRAFAAGDVLEARVEALRLLADETRVLAQARSSIVADLTLALGLPPKAPLRDICSRLTPDRAEPIRALREDLRSAMLDTQLRVRADSLLLRHALDVVSTLVQVIAGSPVAPQSYESAGQRAAASNEPLLFDADL